MNKSEIRKAIFHTSGCDADDWLEGARRSTYAFEGAKKALKKAGDEVLSVAGTIKNDLDDGKLNKMEPSEIADYAILQVTRARDALLNASLHYANRQLAAQGEISAYERVVNHFKSLHDREDAKILANAAAEADGDLFVEADGGVAKSAGVGGGRITGVRPTIGLAAQRRAEAAAEAEVPAEEPTETKDKPKSKARKPKKKGTDG